MANVVETDTRDREVIVDRERVDSEPRSAAMWIIVAIVAVVLLLWLFGGSMFKGSNNSGTEGTTSTPDTNIQLDTGAGTGTGAE